MSFRKLKRRVLLLADFWDFCQSIFIFALILLTLAVAGFAGARFREKQLINRVGYTSECYKQVWPEGNL